MRCQIGKTKPQKIGSAERELLIVLGLMATVFAIIAGIGFIFY